MTPGTHELKLIVQIEMNVIYLKHYKRLEREARKSLFGMMMFNDIPTPEEFIDDFIESVRLESLVDSIKNGKDFDIWKETADRSLGNYFNDLEDYILNVVENDEKYEAFLTELSEALYRPDPISIMKEKDFDYDTRRIPAASR